MPEITELPTCVFFAVLLDNEREHFLGADEKYCTPGKDYDANFLDQLIAAGYEVIIVFDPKRCAWFDPARYTPAQLQKRVPSAEVTKHLFTWRANGAGSFLKAYDAFKQRRPLGLKPLGE